jgi:hypothetical protein
MASLSELSPPIGEFLQPNPGRPFRPSALHSHRVLPWDAKLTARTLKAGQPQLGIYTERRISVILRQPLGGSEGSPSPPPRENRQLTGHSAALEKKMIGRRVQGRVTAEKLSVTARYREG